MDQVPTVGRAVHYRPKNSGPGSNADRKAQPYAATITHVNTDGSVNLMVCGDVDYPLDGTHYPANVMQGDGAGQWCWPPRV
ncbi:MAG: hypothetical protein IT435_15960 [Phycisphaerales bacterium]|nr:hypothetical protein [Phycisphaerales bacterium]